MKKDEQIEEITEFPEQTTFNTEDLSLLVEEENKEEKEGE